MHGQVNTSPGKKRMSNNQNTFLGFKGSVEKNVQKIAFHNIILL